MAHPKGLMKLGMTRPIRANRTPFVWTDVSVPGPPGVFASFWSLTVPLNIEDKKAVVAEVSAQVAKAQTIVVAEYRGITVGDLTKLRATARTQNHK